MTTGILQLRKTRILATAGFLLCLQFSFSQNSQEELAPDQNPNYRVSLEKYMAIKDNYTKLQGTTAQNTYKAIDDVQAKKDRKALRKERRQERRLARINSRRHRHWGYIRPFNYGWGYSYNYPLNMGVGTYSHGHRGYLYWGLPSLQFGYQYNYGTRRNYSYAPPSPYYQQSYNHNQCYNNSYNRHYSHNHYNHSGHCR